MAFSKVKVGGLADDSVTAANIDDDGTGYTVGNLTNSGTLQQTGQATFGSGGTNWTLPTARGTDKYVLQINGTTGAADWAESLTAPEISGHNFDVSGSTDDGGINAYEAPYEYTGTTNETTTISSLSSTTGLLVGQYISGPGIPADTTISSINSGASSIVISNQATASASGVALKIQKTPGEKNGGKVTLTGANFGATIGEISVAITNSSGSVIANASYLSGLSGGNTITAEWTGTEGSYSTDLTSSYTGSIYFKMTKSGLASNVHNTNTTLTSDPSATALSGSSQTGGDVFTDPSATSLGAYGSGRIAGGGQDGNTELLLNFDRTGGTDIEDSSNTGGNGHKVTATNAVIKASPFGDGKTAMYFNGSSDYLEIPDSSDFDFGAPSGNTNDFTIELWFYALSLTGDKVFIARNDHDGTDSEWWIRNDDHAYDYYRPKDSHGQIANGVFVTNKWTHLAVVRDQTNVKIFVDGKLVSSVSNSDSWEADSGSGIGHRLVIGARHTGSSYAQFFSGYMDEIRIVKGTAVYTSDFTVPTSRLTAITNTKLLIHSDQSYDSSSHRHQITLSGIAFKTDQSKFGIVDGGGTTRGGSISFDGSNDLMTVSDSIIPQLDAIGTGAFSIETWVRPDNNTSEHPIISFSTSGNNPGAGFFLVQRGDRSPKEYEIGVTGTNATFDFSWSTGTWYHLALTRSSSGVCKFFINGEQRGPTGADSSHTFNATGTLDIAWDQLYIGKLAYTSSGLFYDGYIDNLRLSNTERTITTSNYQTERTNDSNTLLLVNGNQAAFADSSSSGHTITPTGSFHSQGHGGIAPAMTWPASGKATGSAGVYFDGSGDYLTVGTSSLFSITSDTQSFTFECWVYPVSINTSTTSGHEYRFTAIISKGIVHLNFGYKDDGTIRFYTWDGAPVYRDTSSGIMKIGQWQHLAVVSNSGTLAIYYNGESKTLNSTTLSAPNGGFDAPKIGHADLNQTSDGLHGYLDGIRISDTARYTSNFTPPTRAYGAFGQETPDVGTITLTATGDGDFTWSEVAGGTALPGTLAVGSTTHSGSGNSRTHTATITGTLPTFTSSTFTNGVRSDLATNNILLKVQHDTDATKAVTLNGATGMGITQKSTEKPVLFNARRYAGNAVQGREITGFGFGSPDLVWIKCRSDGHHHNLFDSVRGVDANNGNKLIPNANTAQNDGNYGYGHIKAFTSEGFTLENGTQSGAVNQHVNMDGETYIAWTWKAGGKPSSSELSLSGGVGAGIISSGISGLSSVTQSVNQNSGFSITKYTGGTAPSDATGHLGSFPHNLGGTPDFIIVKSTHSANSWAVWHSGLTNASTSGAGVGNVYLDLDVNEQTNSNGQSDHGTIQPPSSTTITLRKGGTSSLGVNNYSGAYICYAWKAVAGLSAFGTYEGDGGSVRTITTGFRPRFVMVKNIDSNSTYWAMIDNFRQSGDTITKQLYADLTNAEDTGNHKTMTFSNTGFGFTSASTYSAINENAKTFIYMAFA